MVGPESVLPFGQAMPQFILQRAYDTLNLTITLAVSYRWLLVHYAQCFTKARKATFELRSMVSPHIPRFPPTRYHLRLQKVCSAPTVERRNRARFHPLGEGIDRYQKEAVAVAILRKWTSGINAPPYKRCGTLVDPLKLLHWWRWRALLLTH